MFQDPWSSDIIHKVVVCCQWSMVILQHRCWANVFCELEFSRFFDIGKSTCNIDKVIVSFGF